MGSELRKYCLALDLKEDPELIDAYIKHHQLVWPEVIKSIYGSGIIDMEIYLVYNRLFMIMVVDDNFSFAQKSMQDSEIPEVVEWEGLMSTFQQKIRQQDPEKWLLMNQIFDLKKYNEHGKLI